MHHKLDHLKDEYLTEENMWALTALLSAVIAAVVMRGLLKSGWKWTRGEEPPGNPIAADVGWSDALLWGALTGAVVGMARVISRRGAASAWRRWVGDLD